MSSDSESSSASDTNDKQAPLLLQLPSTYAKSPVKRQVKIPSTTRNHDIDSDSDSDDEDDNNAMNEDGGNSMSDAESDDMDDNEQVEDADHSEGREDDDDNDDAGDDDDDDVEGSSSPKLEIPKKVKSKSKVGKIPASRSKQTLLPFTISTPKAKPTKAPPTATKSTPKPSTPSRQPSSNQKRRSPTKKMATAAATIRSPARKKPATPKAKPISVKSIISTRPKPRSYNSADNDEFVPAMFPLARVRGFIKQDDQVANVSPEAVALLSSATDKFVDFFVEQSLRLSQASGNKKEIPYDKVSQLVESDTAMHFLKALIPPRSKFGKVKTKLKQK